MAGGALPSAPVVALATGVLVLLGVAMSGREWRLPSLLIVLVGAQLALHVALAGGAEAQSHAMPGMSHAGMADMGTLPGLTMSAMHVGAAVLAAVLLRRGEQWCLSLVDLLGRPVRAIRMVVVPLPRQRRLPVQAPPPSGARTRHLSPSLSRRGPPALSPA
jgi:hypothetical protein